MSGSNESLTQQERAELERLRAEKAARERTELAHRERVARERTLMEPGDDLSMPLGQKIVLAVVAALVIGIVAVFLLAPK